jgi:hypothetical protein
MPQTCLVRSIIQLVFNNNAHKSSCKAPTSFQILMRLEFPRQFFQNEADTKFHEYFSKETRCLVLWDRQRDKMFSVVGSTERQKDIMKVTVAFHSFGLHFKMGSTSTEYLRIFRQSCRHSSR